MASITIRQLDESLKQQLRLRAAATGSAEAAPVRAPPRRSDPPAMVSGIPLSIPRTAALAAMRRILLIIGGGIAAYKSLDLIRRLRERHMAVRCILTAAAQEFITPLAAGALAGERAFTDLFDAASELDVGHIRLARDTDAIVVAPATADLMAKMAGGHANDLASAVLLATSRPILIAPAMNPVMWARGATQRNLVRLIEDGVVTVGPNAGEMAEAGEAGVGRMAEPL